MMTPKIIEYKVLVVRNHIIKKDGSSMTDAIKKEIESGWIPFGGVAAEGDLLFQALVKYE
jgi:hypothetical protein